MIIKTLYFIHQISEHSVPKRCLPLQAELVINRLRSEAMVERQHAALNNDDDVPHSPSADPMSNPQSRRTAVHVS